MWCHFHITNSQTWHNHNIEAKCDIFYSSQYYPQVIITWWLHWQVSITVTLCWTTRWRYNEDTRYFSCEFQDSWIQSLRNIALKSHTDFHNATFKVTSQWYLQTTVTSEGTGDLIVKPICWHETMPPSSLLPNGVSKW